jgi:hypothetical protein
MAIPGITYRLEKGTSLTHTEMDNNFRSLFYSSSIQDGGDTLWLHYDTDVNDYEVIPLSGGSGGLTITGNVDNRVVTATGTPGLIQGETNFTFDGDVLTITGRVSQDDGDNNVFIGLGAGDSISGATRNIGIGYRSGKNLTGNSNVSYGYGSLENALASSNTVAIGYNSLNSINSGNTNVALGASAGLNLSSGAGNLYLGNAAGPSTATGQSDKLYINNFASDTPLVLGDFATGQITFSGGVTGSSFTGSFVGDGSNLTGLTVTEEWDGTRDGDAEITGSFLVSGSSVNVDFTNTTGVSGSFSGSFVGDGSGLTGIISDPSDTYKVYQIGAGTNSIVPVNGGNTSLGDCSTVGGGYCNIADDYLATVGGGGGNTAYQASTVGGGFDNSASGCYSTVGGGTNNTISGNYSSILGGKSNCILEDHSHSHIIGSNITSSKACTTFVNNLDVEGAVSASIFSGSFVGDGSGLTGIEAGSIAFEDITNKPTLISSSLQFNDLTSPFTGSFTGSFTGDGSGLTGIISDPSDTYKVYQIVAESDSIIPVNGGNSASGYYSTIGGGRANITSGNCSTVSGGYCNLASGSFSTVGGGVDNIASGSNSTIGGGYCNIALGECSTVSGGYCNIASGSRSTLSGGYCNTASGYYSTIGGGCCNTASGNYSSILGGQSNCVSEAHSDSHIIGSNINSTATCYTFVNNLCNIGGGTSDCRLKENIQDIPYGLTQVKQLEPVSYNFINDESKKTKYGFLAQCVQEIFPELIYYHPTDKVDGEPVLQFDKEAIWVSLVNAIKEQQEQIVRLEERILLLENK